MAKASSPSFVCELPLVTNLSDERILLDRLESGRRLYNAVLCEALKRLRSMRESKEWRTAAQIPGKKVRNKAFRDLQKANSFTEYALHDFVAISRVNGGWEKRLGSHECQALATRAWKTVSNYAFGQGGKPRFKGRNRPLHSLEGKTNKACIRFSKESGVVLWNKLALPVKVKHSDYISECLKSDTKFCRVLWRNIKGQRRWFVQLVQKGKAPERYQFHAHGFEVGLDIGPSTIAITSETASGLERFVPSVDQPWAEMRRLQRALDRSRRATNPENYHPNGVPKKGARRWHKSSRYHVLENQLRECERVLAARRKSDHGMLANKIVGLGNVIKTEKLSYKAFQKNYGKSVKQRAPGMFVELLNRKAESAGGKVVELNTWKLKMSQFDHTDNSYTKKSLSQRYQYLAGIKMIVQRDSYSAFLALNAQGDEHDLSRLHESWATVEPLLRRVRLCVDESVSGKAPAFPTVAIPSELIARQKVLG